MRLTQVTSITFATPLIVALLVGPLLGERLGASRIVAVLVGFAGVLVGVLPAANCIRQHCSRWPRPASTRSIRSRPVLAAHDPAETTLFFIGLVGAALFLPVIPFIWTSPSTLLGWLLLPALGGFGVLGHWLLILAHRRAPASVVAPSIYTQLIWASGLGFLLFGDAPDRWTLAGGAIVVASGLFLVAQERTSHPSH